MTTKYVKYCLPYRLPCANATRKEIIICLQDADLIVQPDPACLTPVTTIDGEICQAYTLCDSCTNIIWNYTFSYDDAQLTNPTTPLIAGDIVGVFCRDCETDWVEQTLSCVIQPLPCVTDTATIDLGFDEEGCLIANAIGVEYPVGSETDFIAAIAGGYNMLVYGPVTLTDNRTTATSVRVINGGQFITDGNILTLNGPFSSGAFQCFDSSVGEVIFRVGSILEVLPQWFGAIGDNSTDCTSAFAQASSAIDTYLDGRIYVSPGTFRHNGISLKARQSLIGAGAISTTLRYVPTTGNGITLGSAGVNSSYNVISDVAIDCVTTSSGCAISGPPDPAYVADITIDRYEIEDFLIGIYIPYGLQIHIGFGRLAGQGKAVANGVGVQLGDRTLGTPRLVNTGRVAGAYCNGYETSFTLDGSILMMEQVTSENCDRAVLVGTRCFISGSWIQADTTLYQTRVGGWIIGVYNCYHLDGANIEVDDPSTMSILVGSAAELSIFDKSEFKGAGQFRLRFADSVARGVRLGSVDTSGIYGTGGSVVIEAVGIAPLRVNRDAAGGVGILDFYQQGVIRGKIGVNAAAEMTLQTTTGNGTLSWDDLQNVQIGLGTLATGTMTSGLIYIPSCNGTPTGVPTGKTGFVPLIVDATNNKLYFYSGGAWRDAGP